MSTLKGNRIKERYVRWEAKSQFEQRSIHDRRYFEKVVRVVFVVHSSSKDGKKGFPGETQ